MTRKPYITFVEKLSLSTYSELFTLWFMVNLVCALIYFMLATVHSPNAPTHLDNLSAPVRLFNSVYFSLTTGTSVGYGDIVPQGFSKVLAMLQAMLSLLIFALFVTKLVSRRQDTTLEEVHRMTSESIFYNIRQGLFLVRKDFDLLLHELDIRKELTDQDREILTTAYLQGQNLIEEIPNLYNGHAQDLYTIDLKREKLLLEAIFRTLRRIEKFLHAMEKHDIDWRSHEDSSAELRELLQIIHTVMPLWRRKSPSKEKIVMFDDIVALNEKLRGRLEEKMQ